MEPIALMLLIKHKSNTRGLSDGSFYTFLKENLWARSNKNYYGRKLKIHEDENLLIDLVKKNLPNTIDVQYHLVSEDGSINVID